MVSAPAKDVCCSNKFKLHLLPELSKKQCHPFIVDGMLVGLIRPDIYKHLLDYKDVFNFHPAPQASSSSTFPQDDYRVGAVELCRQYKSYEERTNVVDRVLRELREKRCLVALKGWRDEVGYLDQYIVSVKSKNKIVIAVLRGQSEYAATDANGQVGHLPLWHSQLRRPH